MSMKDTPSPIEQLYAEVCAGNVPANVYTSNDGTCRISAFKTGVSYLKLKDTSPDLNELKSWEFEKGTQTLIFAWSSGRTTRLPSQAAPDTQTGASNTASLTVSEPSPMIGLETSVALKFDTTKPRLDLLPTQPLIEVAEVLTFGAKKYAEYNWAKGISYSRLFGATMRHLWAWWVGEDNDSETGKSHLAHAICCLLFALQYKTSRPEFDDRPIKHYAPKTSN